MPTLLQSLVTKAESVPEHLVADVRVLLIKAHEDFDALLGHEKAIVEKEETKVETDLDAAPKTESTPSPAPTGIAAENEVGNDVPAVGSSAAAAAPLGSSEGNESRASTVAAANTAGASETVVVPAVPTETASTTEA